MQDCWNVVASSHMPPVHLPSWGPQKGQDALRYTSLPPARDSSKQGELLAF